MTANWIICERTSTWAAALRTSVARAGKAADRVTIHETRRLNELTAQLRETYADLALVEVTSENLDTVLIWLADHQIRPSAAPVAILLDYAFTNALRPPQLGDHEMCRAVVDALREAGAVDVALSPRELDPVVKLGMRCLAKKSPAGLPRPGDNESIEQWAFHQLPWQDVQ
jgi:hypothetical protein